MNKRNVSPDFRLCAGALALVLTYIRRIMYKNLCITFRTFSYERWVRAAWVVSTVTSQQRVPGSIPTWGLSVWSLHVLPVYAWVLSGYSGFLPPSKNIHVRLIDVSEIVLRSERVWLFVSMWPCDGLATCPGCTPPLA